MDFRWRPCTSPIRSPEMRRVGTGRDHVVLVGSRGPARPRARRCGGHGGSRPWRPPSRSPPSCGASMLGKSRASALPFLVRYLYTPAQEVWPDMGFRIGVAAPRGRGPATLRRGARWRRAGRSRGGGADLPCGREAREIQGRGASPACRSVAGTHADEG